MIARTTIALIVSFVTVGSALAATKQPQIRLLRESASYMASPALAAYGSEQTRDPHNNR
jgi:hypothetical protein